MANFPYQRCKQRSGICRAMLNSTSLVVYSFLFAVPAYITYRLLSRPKDFHPSTQVPAEDTARPLKTVMQAARKDLAQPKDDPFTYNTLKGFDGSDPTKPIYVAIKGSCFFLTTVMTVFSCRFAKCLMIFFSEQERCLT